MTLLNVIFQQGSTRIRTGVAGFKVPSDNHLHYKTKKSHHRESNPRPYPY